MDQQEGNAESLRFRTFEFAGNAEGERFGQSMKHDTEIASTEEGISIDSSAEQRSNV
jgi:hypothetical protein